MIDVVKETKFRGSSSRIDKSSDRPEEREDDSESTEFYPGEEVGASEKPEKVEFDSSVASEMSKTEDPVAQSSSFTFSFKKVPAGGSNTIVEIKRSDGRETTQTFPNPARADEFIETMQKRIADAKIAKENSDPNAVAEPKYGVGISLSPTGELVIVAQASKESTVVIPEMAQDILKFLGSRSVDAFGVSERGLTLITSKDGQKVTFLYSNGRTIISR